MDDTRLAHDLARDLDASFETLVHAHLDRCHAIALRMTGDPQDAEEVALDALVRAYRALASYEPERVREIRLRPWLATIVVNLCHNRARRRRLPATSLAPLVEAGIEPASPLSAGPDAVSVRTALRTELARQLMALPERYRVPVVLRHVDDLSYAEIAMALGRPEGTLKSQVHRGLALLRAAMGDTDLEELTT